MAKMKSFSDWLGMRLRPGVWGQQRMSKAMERSPPSIQKFLITVPTRMVTMAGYGQYCSFSKKFSLSQCYLLFHQEYQKLTQ